MSEARRVLVIDDDAEMRLLLSVALETLGVDTEVAEDGFKGMAAVSAAVPDLIVLDLMMPVMDGLRFLGWLRGEARLDVPVIVLSATGSREALTATGEAGADAVISKPVDLDQLLLDVERLLGRR